MIHKMINNKDFSSEIIKALENVPKSGGDGIKIFIMCFSTLVDIDFSIKSNVCFNLYANPRGTKANAESYAGYFAYGKFNNNKLTTKRVQTLLGNEKILRIDCTDIREIGRASCRERV